MQEVPSNEVLCFWQVNLKRRTKMTLGDPLFSLSFLDIFPSFLLPLAHLPVGSSCSRAVRLGHCVSPSFRLALSGAFLFFPHLPHLWVLTCFPDPRSPPSQLTPTGVFSDLTIMDSVASPPGGRRNPWYGGSGQIADRKENVTVQNQAQDYHKSSGIHSTSSPQ